MDIKVLFESRKASRPLLVGWGVSYLVDNQILFDAGERFAYLSWNMRALGVSISDIKGVVISHEHWDHTNGLWDILKEKPGLPLYICPNFSLDFKSRAKSSEAHVIQVKPFTEIVEGIYTTGEIPAGHAASHMPEQALLLRTTKGLTIVSGCAHAGITKVVQSVRQRFSDPIHMVLGGFHTLDGPETAIRSVIDRFKQLGVENVAPGHCTGEDGVRLLKEAYGTHCLKISVGETIEA